MTADRIVRLRDQLKAWALHDAFPLWWTVGADHEKGGFFEKIDLDGSPVEAPRRARVQPRQIYAYAAAGLLGWDGPWKAALEHGLDFYLSKYRRPDGFMRTLVASDGTPLDDKVDLYDQAFGLFGLAMAAQVLPERTDLPLLAVGLRDSLYATLKHPVAGFEESVPRSVPLLSNPHMHLFEASLAWVEAGGDAGWRAMADEIAELALAKFIDPASGGLREYYDGDWNPAPGLAGRIIEPGHQFEWAWLLLRWSRLADRQDAAAAALRMIEIGDGPGVDPVRGVAVFSLLDDMSVHEDVARLWAQTERIKAGVLAAKVTGDPRWWDTAAGGAEGLLKYFDTPVKGLWRDKLLADGTFVDEAAPASSFYHIVCAILELDQALADGAYGSGQA
ncbi:mannose-6-phosphate isomerase [Caulobacter sp. D4A]|nr:AGE family epimerase/isomerase [Caulobacter sp. D4A]PXA83962.1 mannose-6-phosphate isomerase [Caulobacter sp. D4A]